MDTCNAKVVVHFFIPEVLEMGHPTAVDELLVYQAPQTVAVSNMFPEEELAAALRPLAFIVFAGSPGSTATESPTQVSARGGGDHDPRPRHHPKHLDPRH